jgi:hypothetical protein
MASQYRSERVIYYLEQNLRDFNEVEEEYQEIYNETFDYIISNIAELPEVMDDIDEYHNFQQDTFDKAILLDFVNFSKGFKRDYNFLPLSPTLMFDKTWNNLVCALDYEKDDIYGIYFNSSLFKINSFSIFCQNLSKTGIIFMKNPNNEKGLIRILEHELLHSAIEKYSLSFQALKSIPYSSDYEHYVNAHKTEIKILEELIANQRYLVEDIKYSIKFMNNYYLLEYIKDMKENFKENHSEIDRVKNYIISRVNVDTKNLVKIFEDYPSHIITPILISVGPTVENIKNLQTTSPFDDFITWSEILGNHKIYKKAKDILKSKGYNT